MDTGQMVTLVAFLILLFLAIAAGARMQRIRQPALATICGGIAGFVFLLGLWFLITGD